MNSSTIINSIEALFVLGGGIWGLSYYKGWFNWTGEKERRRAKRVEDYGIILIIGITMCFVGSGIMLLGVILSN